jgi:hypothetical protein
MPVLDEFAEALAFAATLDPPAESTAAVAAS